MEITKYLSAKNELLAKVKNEVKVETLQKVLSNELLYSSVWNKKNRGLFTLEEMELISSEISFPVENFTNYKNYLHKLSEFINHSPIPKSYWLKILGKGTRDTVYLTDRIKNPYLWKDKDIKVISKAISEIDASIPR